VGVLAFASTHTRDTRKLVWYDAQGRQLGLVDEGDRFRNPALSPDERALAIERYRDAAVELRVYDLARGGWTRVGEAGDRSRDPVWSGDSRMIAYVSDRDGYETVPATRSRASRRDDLAPDTIKMPPTGRPTTSPSGGERGDYDAWLPPAMAAAGSSHWRRRRSTSQRAPRVTGNGSPCRTSRPLRSAWAFSVDGGRMASTGGAVDPAWADAGELVFIDPVDG
jgi:hypothetical protein